MRRQFISPYSRIDSHPAFTFLTRSCWLKILTKRIHHSQFHLLPSQDQFHCLDLKSAERQIEAHFVSQTFGTAQRERRILRNVLQQVRLIRRLNTEPARNAQLHLGVSAKRLVQAEHDAGSPTRLEGVVLPALDGLEEDVRRADDGEWRVGGVESVGRGSFPESTDCDDMRQCRRKTRQAYCTTGN